MISGLGAQTLPRLHMASASGCKPAYQFEGGEAMMKADEMQTFPREFQIRQFSGQRRRMGPISKSTA